MAKSDNGCDDHAQGEEGDETTLVHVCCIAGIDTDAAVTIGHAETPKEVGPNAPPPAVAPGPLGVAAAQPSPIDPSADPQAAIPG